MFPYPNSMPFQPVPSKLPMAPALYIGNLHETIDEQLLFDFFSKFGNVHFVRVMRDITTGKSRGYGFVNYVSARDAESAKQYGQYEVIAGQSIRIMFRGTISQESNLVIKNLDKAINEKQLHEFFNQAGSVTSVHIRRFRDVSQGYVSYSSVLEAENAVATLNNQRLGEKNLVIEKFVVKKERDTKKSLYLKNLPFENEEEATKWLLSTFEQYGELTSYKAFRFQTSLFSAFLCYKNDEDAVKAFTVVSQNPITFSNGGTLYINWHLSKNARKDELAKSNIYLKNLKPETTAQDVEHIFKAMGKVENVALRDWESKDKKRKAKFGFVLFSQEETAQSVLKNISSIPDLQTLALENSRVEVFPYQTKKTRQAYLHSLQRRKQFEQSMNLQRYQYNMIQNPMAAFNRFGGGQYQNPQGFNPRRSNTQPHQPRTHFSQGPNFNGNPRYQNQNPRAQNFNNRNPQYPNNQRRGNAATQPQANPKPQVQPNVNQVANNTRAQPITQPRPQPASELINAQNIRARMNDIMALDPDRRKKLLGESLYPLVLRKTNEKLAPKITGMLIDLETDEVIDLIEVEKELNERISEAVELLNEEGIAQ